MSTRTMRNVADLSRDPRNARKHPKRSIEEIKSSLVQFGQQKPIVVDKSGKVIAGNGTLTAASELGWTELWAETTTLDAKAAKAYAIVDNRSAELSDWDRDALGGVLEELRASDVNVTKIGFTEAELRNILTPRGQERADDGSPAPIPRAKNGDLFALGDHRLLCGDSTLPESVARVCDRAAMVFTDPPYNVDYKGGARLRDGISNDALGAEFAGFIRKAIDRMCSVCDGAVYIAMGDSEYGLLKEQWVAAGAHYSGAIVWDKMQFTMGRSDYQRQHEMVLYGWPKSAKRQWHGGRTESTIWSLQRPHASEDHPTMKPVELVERAIVNSSSRGDVVLDLFGGSGTTLIACENLERRCAMIELSPAYCDVILRRWEKHTGREATLVEVT